MRREIIKGVDEETLNRLVLPEVPDYIPQDKRLLVEKYLRRYTKLALQYGLKNYEQAHRQGLDSRLGLSRLDYLQKALESYRLQGWLLPTKTNPAAIGENYFAVGKDLKIGPTHVGSCLGGLIINEQTNECVGYHLYPLNNWEDDKEAFKIAVGYFKFLKSIAPRKITRFDMASSKGGFRWDLDTDERLTRETRDHQIYLRAFEKVFGRSVKVSRWTTAQIQYDYQTKQVIDPKTRTQLPKEGALEWWVDLIG